MLDNFFEKYKIPITILLIGLGLLGGGILLVKSQLLNLSGNKIEVIQKSKEADPSKDIVVEIAGAVEKADIYHLSGESRIEDLLTAAGGLSAGADRGWVEKNINKAAKLTDGQKIYIPYQSDVLSANNKQLYQPTSSSFSTSTDSNININTASDSELEKLPGIGPVYAQKIIEQRPYSSVDELLSKGVVRQNIYDDIKDMVAVY